MCVYIHILYCYIATLLSCILRTFPVMLEEMRKEDQRVKYLWEVLEKFSNEDRSRFLRFVTGRRRLPAIMHVVGESVPDFFPSLCSCFYSCANPEVVTFSSYGTVSSPTLWSDVVTLLLLRPLSHRALRRVA